MSIHPRRAPTHRIWRSRVVPALVALLLTAVATQAQQLRYVTESRVEMGGMLAAMTAAMGDMDETIVETTTVGMGAMRTDADGTSTIVKLGEGSMIEIDHEARTWSRFDFGDFGTMLEEMRAENEADAQEEISDVPQMTGDFSLERTNVSRPVNGFDAEQVLMTIQLQPEEGGMMQGQLVMLLETWMSSGFVDHPAMVELTEEARNFLRNGGEVGVNDMSAVMMGSEQMGAALQRFQEELRTLDGMPVRTTSLFLILPEGAELDRDAALASMTGELPSDGPGLADLMSGSSDAARSALGRFGLGGGDDEGEEAPAQQILLRVVQETRDIESVNVDPSLFEPPAGYEQVESPTRGLGGR